MTTTHTNNNRHRASFKNEKFSQPNGNLIFYATQNKVVHEHDWGRCNEVQFCLDKSIQYNGRDNVLFDYNYHCVSIAAQFGNCLVWILSFVW